MEYGQALCNSYQRLAIIVHWLRFPFAEASVVNKLAISRKLACSVLPLGKQLLGGMSKDAWLGQNKQNPVSSMWKTATVSNISPCK